MMLAGVVVVVTPTTYRGLQQLPNPNLAYNRLITTFHNFSQHNLPKMHPNNFSQLFTGTTLTDPDKHLLTGLLLGAVLIAGFACELVLVAHWFAWPY